MSSVRVVARVRPLQNPELAKDSIVVASSSSDGPASNQLNTIRLPNPRNGGEDFSFQFHSVYDQGAAQQTIFDNEVAPTIKHLFSGFDVTLFAYGVTGTGKTHTMRGGKTLADRGVIPRLLSGIYRRSRKVEKDSHGETSAEVTMSYYEIYNDRVFDLFEAPEKRTATGLQLKDNGGKTVVVGLTERPCESLKEFEKLYDQANVNRSTSATKLNAHSSRSHAILCVKLIVTTGETSRISRASAIDLAGSEDNRRTENGKERLVESASINKSLFVLAQCVEAIGRNQARVPYRESKMTRILSLGQNKGLTIMILNISPLRSYHLDTLSSLNFANRTKKIEIKEVENEPIFKGCPRAIPSFRASTMQRQPLRPLSSAFHNATVSASDSKPADKPPKAFSVYSDKGRPRPSNPGKQMQPGDQPKVSSPLKRPSDPFIHSRPLKHPRSSQHRSSGSQPSISKATIEEIIEKKVTEILAARALDQPTVASAPEISEQVQRRLELLEHKIEGQNDGRAEGLTFLLMAKQHHVRGEDSSALKMYQIAKEYFPDNAKLEDKIVKVRRALEERRFKEKQDKQGYTSATPAEPILLGRKSSDNPENDGDDEYQVTSEPASDDVYTSDDGIRFKSKSKRVGKRHGLLPKGEILREESPGSQSPRTKELLGIINTRDLTQIKLLKGVGAKKATAIVEALCADEEDTDAHRTVNTLGQLGRLKGVGAKTVENMRSGLTGWSR